jgi:Fe-S cluster assembly iron-binding protein IscA
MFAWLSRHIKKIEVYGIGVELREVATSAPAAVPPGAGEAPVVALTPAAAQFVHWHCGQSGVSGDWYLRIGVEALPGGVGRYSADLETAVGPDDEVFLSQGVRVVVARSQADMLRGAVVGYGTGPEGAGFFVENPRLPDYRRRELDAE